MLAVSSMLDLRNNPDVLCFIAAYNGVIDDYSMYNNKVYVGDGVAVSERSSASAVGSMYNITFPHQSYSSISGLLVTLESDLCYGSYTVMWDGRVTFVIGTPLDWFGICDYDSAFNEITFCTKYTSKTTCKKLVRECRVVNFVIDRSRFIIQGQCSSGGLVPLIVTSNSKYLHMGVIWNLDFQSLHPVSYIYTRYQIVFSYFLICRGKYYSI